MRLQFEVVLSLVAFTLVNSARGGVLDGSRSLHDHRDRHAQTQYNFTYVVNDPPDFKTQWETRDGDVVKGCYSLLEPDGTIRHVEYKADKRSGFIAVVKKMGKVTHLPNFGPKLKTGF